LNKKLKNLSAKMIDYKRFAITLLCVGSFFYLGTILPTEGKTAFDMNGYMLASVLFLAASIACFLQSSRYKKNLAELNELDSQ